VVVEDATKDGHLVRVAVGAALAMVAFAANSLLTRAALDSGGIDAASFTLVRLGSGALVLAAIVSVRRGAGSLVAGAAPWRTAGMLFGYAAAFSLAYLRIGAGVGALVLFGTVQTVIYATAIRRGDKPGAGGWIGLMLAMTGLVALAAPGVTAPDLIGVALMVVAGVSWAAYTLAGRRSTADPITTTARNFLWSVPLALVLELLVAVTRPGTVHVDGRGIVLALASGSIASGLGYALWYATLPALTRVQSGILQMSPPPIAAVGGLLLLGETVTARVALASVLILAGVAVGILGSRRR
jgi:drug/metabolite transporter (DMT)-like permease